jgi:PAS domain-containing protein
MSDSPSRSRKTRSPGAAEPPAGGHGVWKLTLWNGSVRFNPWFYRRLQWPAAVKRTRLDDLQPYLPAGAWEELLLAIRNHLERQVPLDIEVRVQIDDNRLEWWRVQGSVERNAAGQPIYLGGTMREVSAGHRDPPAGSLP